jgi:DNA-binding NarL/FixJ family response regulator
MAITVSIVEDDAGVRDGLVRLLGRAKDFRCLGGYPSAEAALRELPAAPPDVVLMDINLPGMNGVECVRKLKVQAPSIQILMLTVYENPEQIFEALTAGATGYLLKQMPPAELLAALREVHRGGAPMSSQIARKVVQSFQIKVPAGQLAELTPREQEILERLAGGDLIKDIADQLGSSFDTVRTHIRRIYEKLHVHSRAQAVAQYRHPSSPPRPQAARAMSHSRPV